MKLWSVKGFNILATETIPNLNGRNEETGVQKYFKRNLVLLGKDLSWNDAKKVRNQFRRIDAMIFPNVKEEELKVITLGEANEG